MTDVVDKSTRSRMMSGIRGKDTKPEVILRSALHRAGFRFRKNVKRLPGRPDIVLPRYKAVILINGCFWHGHLCHLFKWPSTRADFWKQKIESNRARDAQNLALLHEMGWKILIVWECALRGPHGIGYQHVAEIAGKWIQFGTADAEIRGNENPGL